MKKQISYSLVSLLLVTALSSCGDKKSEGTEKPTSPTETITPTTDTKKTEELTEAMLYRASAGIAVESQLVRSTITDNGEVQIVMYNSSYLDFETTIDEYAYRLYSDRYDDKQYKVSDPIPYDRLQPSRNTVSLMRDYVSDSEGMLIDKRISADNHIVRSYGRLDGTTNEKVGISFTTSGFYNPFYSFTASDFVKGEKPYSFVLDIENMQDPASLPFVTSCLTAGSSESELQSLTLYTDGTDITSYEAKMTPIANTDLVPGYTYTFNMSVVGTIVAMGKTDEKVTAHFLKEREGEKIEELESLFTSLRKGNYTEKITYHSRDDEGDFARDVDKTYLKTDHSMVVRASDGTIEEAYYLDGNNRKQRLRYQDGSFYKDGATIVNNSVNPTFSLDSRFFVKDGEDYVFTMLDSGIVSLDSADFSSLERKGTISELRITPENNSYRFIVKGRDNNGAGFTNTSLFSEIGTTENGIDPDNMKSVNDMSWKELLSSSDYETAKEFLTEAKFNALPTLKNGYSEVTASLYKDSTLRLDYNVGNWFELFDEDSNQVPSKTENEKYYTFRDVLYRSYENALSDTAKTSSLEETEENEHITGVTMQYDGFSLTLKILEKDMEKRDITFRISITK